MYSYQINNKVKIIFLIVALLLISLFYYINITISNETSMQLKKQVQSLVKVYNNKIQEKEIDLSYLKNDFIPLLREFKIPMIISTKNSDGTNEYQDLEIQYSKEVLQAAGLRIDIDKTKITKNEEKAIKKIIPIYSMNLEKMVANMDSIYDPLTVIEINGEPIVQIHYADSISNSKIDLIPYIGFCFFITILLLITLGISTIYTSESNFIYAGMARETAHQLGTPISSLLGWIDLMKNNNHERRDDIVKSMENEIDHIKNISNKFNKIGSKKNFKKINLSIIIYDVVDYFNLRIPNSKDIKIIFNNNNDYFINGDDILIYWAFENLIKNSIESIEENSGIIKIEISSKKNIIKLLFFDNGKEIHSKDKSKIFRPGYSSKKRGWGLGLSLSKRIIEYFHNGSIKLLRTNSNEKVFQITFKSSYL